MKVTKFLKPKKTGTTVFSNYGFASTTTNGGNGGTTVLGDVVTASQVNITDTLTATNATIQSLTAETANITQFTSSNGTFTQLNVTQNANFNGRITSYALNHQWGDFYTHGEVRFMSDPQYAYSFHFEDVESYMGSRNYYDELIGGDDSIITATTINTDYLTVNRSAHFFELIIDKVKAAGGCAIFTPADGFTVDKVQTTGNYTYIYWRACSEITEETAGTKLSDATTAPTEDVTANMWELNDQALCQSFNLTHGAGTYQDISNRYWWARAIAVSDEPESVTIGTNNYWCHYIVIYANDPSSDHSYIAQDSMTPAVGDVVAMLGNRTDTTRQGAIVVSAYETYMDHGDSTHVRMTAPYFAEYVNVNDFNLASHRLNWIAANSTTLQGNIKLTSGKTVETYVDEKVADIQTGDQFYTNVLVFSNQNINVPATNAGVPYSGDYFTYIYAMHGNSTLNITNINITSSSYFSISGTGTMAGVIRLTEQTTRALPNDQTTFDVTVTAVTADATPTTITYNGKLFFNKIKDGQKGADGITPIVYELVTSATSRTWETNKTTPSAFPSTLTVRINALDSSNTTNPVENIAAVPTGMSLWYRTYNHNTGQYSSYIEITSNYNYFYNFLLSATIPYSIDIYLNIQAPGSTFDSSKIYDIVSIPLIYDGQNGTDGTNGVDGSSVSVQMNNMKASVSPEDTLVMSVVGRLLWQEGGIIESQHDWTNYKIDVTNDNNYQSGSGSQAPANQMRQIGIAVDNTTGAFSWTKSISNYHTVNGGNYSYRPTTLYVDVKNPSSYTVASFNIPVVFEAGATLTITDAIRGTVQSQAGEISILQQTATDISTRVDNNTGNISSLQQTATGLTASVSYIENNYATSSYLNSRLSETYTGIISYVSANYENKTDATTSYNSLYSTIQQTATSITSTVASTYETKSDANSSYTSLYSTIQQTATDISLTISDDLQDTGIDIEQGTITLNADNTIINGNLAIRAGLYYAETYPVPNSIMPTTTAGRTLIIDPTITDGTYHGSSPTFSIPPATMYLFTDIPRGTSMTNQRITMLELPQASLYDGLEISVFNLCTVSDYNVTFTQLRIKANSADYLYSPYGGNFFTTAVNRTTNNVMNKPLTDTTTERGPYYLRQYPSQFKSGNRGDSLLMFPNVFYKFKAINGNWYVIDGLFTGE